LQIIIGASSLEQAKMNIAACKMGPLPEEMLAIFNDGWQAHKADCPSYFR
jgi:aflatoxin B1 aldehyde reductase